jgi:hypothetical protein
MIERPARVRIRRRNPWVRLRRRLLGWNVRLVTGKLPNLRSGRQFRYGAHTARIAGGASRWQRPLWKRPSNGTGHRQTGQTDASRPMQAWPARLGGIKRMLGLDVQRTRRRAWRISQTRLHGDSAIASVALRLSVSTQLPHPAVGRSGGCIYAHSVDICVEAAEVNIPRVPTPQREGADNSRSLLRVSGLRSDATRLRSHQ